MRGELFSIIDGVATDRHLHAEILGEDFDDFPVKTTKAWEEDQHPRDKDGKFSEAAGGGADRVGVTEADAQGVADELGRQYGVPMKVKWFEDTDLPGADALAFAGGDSVMLSRKNWTPETLAKYEKEWDGLVVDPSVRGVLTHEYGHRLARAIREKSDKAYGIMKKYAGIQNENQPVREAPSAYAGENLSEFTAESFVTYHTGGRIASDNEYTQIGRDRAMAMWKELLAL